MKLFKVIMKRLPVYLVLMLLLLCPPALSGGAFQELKLNIDTTKWSLSPADLAGINLNIAVDEDWDECLLTELPKLSPSVLRFPAGTEAMFYDWETGDLNYPDYLLSLKGKRKKDSVAIDYFFGIAHKNRSKVAYIVNLFQDSPEKTERLATYVRDKGYKIAYWELGNEAGAKEFSKKFPTPAIYLSVAKAHAAAVRKIFPDAEFAITAQNMNLYESEWNKVIARESEFTNIAVHTYHGPDRTVRTTMHETGIQIPGFVAFNRMMKNSAPKDLDYERVFPGKSIWLSEWNTIYLGMDSQNSMAHALWAGRKFISFLRTPEVKMAAFWDFNSKFFGIVYPSTAKDFIYSVPFYVFKMAAPVLNEAVRSTQLKVTSNEELINGFEAQVIETKDGSKYIFIVNSSGSAMKILLPPAFQASMVRALESESPDVSNGYQFAHSESLRTNPAARVLLNDRLVRYGVLELKPYAIALVGTKLP